MKSADSRGLMSAEAKRETASRNQVGSNGNDAHQGLQRLGARAERREAGVMRQWSTQELKYLEEHAGEGAKAIAKALGRSIDSVKWQAQRCGLSLRKRSQCSHCGQMDVQAAQQDQRLVHRVHEGASHGRPRRTGRRDEGGGDQGEEERPRETALLQPEEQGAKKRRQKRGT